MLNRPPLHYPDEPFHAFLAHAADRYPEHIGLRTSLESYTYRELDGCAHAFGRWLLGEVAGAADRPEQPRVLLALANGAEWLMAMMGTSAAGWAAVLANPRWRREELEHAIALTSPVVIVADGDAVAALDALGLEPRVRRVRVGPGTSAAWTSFDQIIAGGSGRRLDDVVDDWSAVEVALPFSSGTSGLPKAVRHTHRSLVAATVQWKAASLIDERDRLHFFLPLFHIYGLITVANAISAGAPLRLSTRFDLDEMLSVMERERVTIGFGAAPIAVAMANHPRLEEFDLSSLRYFVWAATPIDPAVADTVTRRSGVRWLHAYGATEAPVLHCNPVDHPVQWRLDSPGRPVSDTEIAIAPVAGYPDEGVGEILARGPQVMAGYLPASADHEAFDDGWLRTGDIGWVDADGFLHIVDRLKEMIKVNAFQVAPAELENVLRGHPDVADCAVYGVPDERRGEAPHAAVVRRDGHDGDAAELAGWVAERVAGYKRITAVRFVDAIPRTVSGKILRRDLREADTI